LIGANVAKPNCSKCGALKEGSYKAESWCGKCIGNRRKELRAERREQKGLPKYGSGRDPKCKVCRADKEERYMNGSYCAKCKLERLKAAYDKKNAEQGLEPRRKGRNPICKCGRIKSKPKSGLCNFCEAVKKRAYHENNKESPIYKLKIAARTTLNRYIRLGHLYKKPCEICKCEIVEAHHDDYLKPLEVRWLCKKHHTEHHKNEKK
jgi:hypothetical protein